MSRLWAFERLNMLSLVKILINDYRRFKNCGALFYFWIMVTMFNMKKLISSLLIVAFIVSLNSLPIFSLAAHAQGASYPPQALPAKGKASNRVWTIAEILEEKKRDKPKKPISYCNGGRFKPCVCSFDVAREVQYRPAVEECGGNAGIALTGKYDGVFSAVVRDTDNRDRFPEFSDFGGCTEFERDELGLNKCSAFKVQHSFRIGSGRDKGRLHCLGASGYSSLFSRVVRITAKLADAPNSSNDPIVRWCLKKSTLPLNQA